MYDISQDRVWNILLNLLLDPDVSEIETNSPHDFFYKKKGKRLKIEGLSAGDEARYHDGIKKGLVPHVMSPWEFKDNSYLFEGPLRFTVEGQQIRGRCHIVLPPACDSAQITIAKKSTTLPSIDAIAERGSMSTEMLLFLMYAIQADFTMVMSGGTGAGKTTMLEALSKLMRHDIRIGVAEDAPELFLEQPNVTYLHSVPWQPGMNPNNVATLSWVVAQFQRMRTDKLIIGETRGKEFADFLIAANSGMDGSMTTIHANDPVTCLDKMTNFAMKDSNAPIRSINTDIANSLDIIIQLIILPDGRHRISHIQEITKTLSNNDDAKITTNNLYRYNISDDTFIKTSPMTDALRKKFEAKGIDVSPFMNTAVGSKSGAHSGAGARDIRDSSAGPSLPGMPARPGDDNGGLGGLPRKL